MNRGMDIRDKVKCMRDEIRFKNELVDNMDFRRPNQLYSKYQPAKSQPILKAVVSARGGDLRNVVKQGREKAQFKKAIEPFTQLTQPQNFKLGGGYIS